MHGWIWLTLRWACNVTRQVGAVWLGCPKTKCMFAAFSATALTLKSEQQLYIILAYFGAIWDNKIPCFCLTSSLCCAFMHGYPVAWLYAEEAPVASQDHAPKKCDCAGGLCPALQGHFCTCLKIVWQQRATFCSARWSFSSALQQQLLSFMKVYKLYQGGIS